MSYTESIKCPHCGAEQDTRDYCADYVGCAYFSDGETITERCGQCNEDFEVKISIHASFEVVEGESDEE